MTNKTLIVVCKAIAKVHKNPETAKMFFVSSTSSSDGLAQYCLNLLHLFQHSSGSRALAHHKNGIQNEQWIQERAWGALQD